MRGLVGVSVTSSFSGSCHGRCASWNFSFWGLAATLKLCSVAISVLVSVFLLMLILTGGYLSCFPIFLSFWATDLNDRGSSDCTHVWNTLIFLYCISNMYVLQKNTDRSNKNQREEGTKYKTNHNYRIQGIIVNHFVQSISGYVSKIDIIKIESFRNSFRLCFSHLIY